MTVTYACCPDCGKPSRIPHCRNATCPWFTCHNSECLVKYFSPEGGVLK